MLLSLLNVLLHMRYNSNFHASPAPNGCLMKRARVHKYEQASRREEAELEAQTTRRGVDWEERGPLVVGRLSHTPNHSSPAWRCCVYVPNGEDDTNGCVPSATPGYSWHSRHSKHSKHPTPLTRKLIKIVLASTYRPKPPTAR